MKILVISHMYPQPGRAHYGIFVHEPLRELLARGHEITVIAPLPRTPPLLDRFHAPWRELAAIPRRRQWQDITLLHPRYLLFPRRIDMAGTLRRFRRCVLNLQGLPELAGCDLIHAHAAFPDGGAARQLGEALGLPYLITSHGSDLLRREGWSSGLFTEIHDSLRGAARQLFPSQVARRRAESAGLPAERGTVLWNGFDAARFLAETPPPADSASLRIICVANLIPSKQVASLFLAVARLAETGLPLQLHVVGSGPEGPSLRALARERNLAVEWSDALDRDALVAALRRAQVFALPAQDESFGIVYLEAMATGLPVIACTGEGIADVITDDREGILVPPGDVAALAAALQRLALDPALRRRLGAAGIQRVRDLGWSTHAQKLETLYQEVVDEARAGGESEFRRLVAASSRVLHFLYNSEPDRNGYALRSRYIVSTQHRQGREVQVCTSPFQMSRWGMGPRETQDGILYHRLRLKGAIAKRGKLGWRRILVFMQKAFLQDLLAGQGTRILRQEQPRVLHAHSPAFNLFLARRAARRAGLAEIPIVYEVRGLTEETEILVGNVQAGGWLYRRKRRLEERAMLAAGRVVTLSEGMRADFIARGVPAERLHVVPNGVDCTAIPFAERDDAFAQELGLSPGKTMGYLGTLSRLEGLPWLVDQLAELPEDWRLLVVGWGHQHEEILQHAKTLGLDRRLIAPGSVPHETVSRWYGLMDYFVLPRLRHRVTEMVTPLKPLEAMASGCIVLASDVGGHREILREGRNGFLFRREEPAAFRALLLELAADPRRRRELGEAARRWVEQERSWDKLVRRYETIYDEAATRP